MEPVSLFPGAHMNVSWRGVDIVGPGINAHLGITGAKAQLRGVTVQAGLSGIKVTGNSPFIQVWQTVSKIKQFFKNVLFLGAGSLASGLSSGACFTAALISLCCSSQIALWLAIAGLALAILAISLLFVGYFYIRQQFY